jgi:hypothetical protein
MDKKLIHAAKHTDWGQVVANGGPPCFHLDTGGKGRFCLRAERWAGHLDYPNEYPYHRFVSIEDLLTARETEGEPK